MQNGGVAAIALSAALTGWCGCGPGSTLSQESARSPQPVSHRVIYEGKTVHYLSAGGAGPALVLVHGWASDSRVWNAQIEDFGKLGRVIAVDLPGHGQSDLPGSEFSMGLFARAAAAVMDDAGIDKAVLVGHGNGTPVIRQFYRLFPERTQALVVVDGALKRIFSDEMAEKMKARLAADDFQNTVFAMIEGMPGEGLDQRARDDLKEIGLAQPRTAVLGDCAAGDIVNSLDRLHGEQIASFRWFCQDWFRVVRWFTVVRC